MMCCCRSQIASDYMKFSFNPLCLVYVPAPYPPPPPPPAPPFFLIPGLLSLPVYTLPRGIQGCPKTISLDKNIWHSSFLKIFPNLLFFSAALHPCIFATPSAKKCSPFFHHSTIRESFRIFLSSQLFSPLPDECQLFMPKDFWNLPV